ncbi:MAG: glycoside hydrolase family 95 protein [Eubacteriales bacterium]|nr:glycoside hydrolase family 95 protein [Eubacteriales bacterium]
MHNELLWSAVPARDWLQYFPLGNGHIGCMIGGDPLCSTLSLNDDTLWSGYPRDYTKQNFLENLRAARELLLQNRREEAEKIVETRLTGRFTQAYLPLGDLVLCTPQADIREYRRALDLGSGIAAERYLRNGTQVTSETFISYPDDVLVHTIISEGAIDCEIHFSCPLRHEIRYDYEGLTLTGRAPSDLTIGDVGHFSSPSNRLTYDEPERGMRFAARVELLTNGVVSASERGLSVRGARQVTIVVCSATSFSRGETDQTYAEQTAHNAARRDLTKLREAHVRDHAALFDRVKLELGEQEEPASLKERLSRMRSGKANSSDLSLLFQYGRYLLVASSRRGTQAANLQGIWNHDPIPPWWSGYTLNINLQMNYWLADRTNLGECFEPFADFAKRLCEAGKETAKRNYGAEGSVAHHQSDLWAHSTPVGFDRVRIPMSARWMMWNMPLPWLALQMYDHYEYFRDERFLREELLPVMRETARFLSGTFTRVEGRLCNLPTTSPENMYRDATGRKLAVCKMSAIDIGIAKEFALAYAEVCRFINEPEDAAYWTQFSRDVLDYSISGSGELNEWDAPLEQTEPGHRHFSMLFGIYPGSGLLGSGFELAARKALQARLEHGSGQTGWSAVWAALLLARFGEGNAAHDVLLKLLRENIHDNFFGAHPPNLFQIDANFGFTAAVCELLFQETGGVVHLLPALPAALSCGSLRGVRIHGGHTLSFGWKDSAVEWVELEAARTETVRLVAQGITDCETGGSDGYVRNIELRQGEVVRLPGRMESHR